MNFCRKLKQNSYHFVILSLFTILVLSIPGSASASSKSPYESGYDHGCDDAGISDSYDYYINQPKKGPAYHTDEFMDGYYTGFDSCSYTYEPEPYQSNNEQYSTSNEYPANKQDIITSFCSALQRGDLRAAQALVSLLDMGTLAITAELICAGWSLGAVLDSQ